MRVLIVPVMLFLAACGSPSVPDSGVGFDDYIDFSAQQSARETALREAAARDAALRGGAVPQGPVVSDETTGRAVDLIADAPQDGTATALPQVSVNNPGISDENSFDAVSGRESIESDAARRAAQAEALVVIAPTALPTRRGGTRPNIVAFALETTNLPGQSLYRRSNILTESRFNRACGRYASSDLAQEAFLAEGGPERDRMGVDPDGDGFACFWDPRPFRTARGG